MNIFSTGEKVMCIDSSNGFNLTLNKIYIILKCDSYQPLIQIKNDNQEIEWYLNFRFIPLRKLRKDSKSIKQQKWSKCKEI